MSPKPRAPKTFDPFQVLTRAERTRHLEDYALFLRERDGECDTETFTLSKREAFFRDLEAKPVRWQGDVDETGFYQHLREQARPEIEPRTMLLVAAARANRGESYGVEIELDSFRSRPHRATGNELDLQLMIEERYHTRILAESCRTCGVEPEKLTPRGFERLMIHAMMYLPDRLRWIAILAGEILATEVFNVLRQNVHHFSAEPEVEERLRLLFTEIWTDEVGHAASLRAKLGPIGLRLARLLVPLFSLSLFRAIPQGYKIGLTRKVILSRLRQGLEIPPAFAWMAPEPNAT